MEMARTMIDDAAGVKTCTLTSSQASYGSRIGSHTTRHRASVACSGGVNSFLGAVSLEKAFRATGCARCRRASCATALHPACPRCAACRDSQDDCDLLWSARHHRHRSRRGMAVARHRAAGAGGAGITHRYRGRIDRARGCQPGLFRLLPGSCPDFCRLSRFPQSVGEDSHGST